MQKITVEVREDHLETLARTKPMTALAELMWNALDAEATSLRVEFVENELQGLEAIRIVDNGHGLDFDDAFPAFRNLGGSWKRSGSRTRGRHRMLHGKYGKGRFRAFSLGNRVSWQSTYDRGKERFSFSIEGHGASIGEFAVSAEKELKKEKALPTGMTVEIFDPPVSAELLRGVKARDEVTDIFALYMRQYPDVRISYDGQPLDPANAEQQYQDYGLTEMVMQDGERVQAVLTVVEWNMPGKRGVFLCDEKGFMLHNALPRLHFRGFSYTAYVKSDYIATLDKQGLLQAGELAPDVRQILDAVRGKLREHFALREAERAQDVLTEWQRLGMYPYEGQARSDAEVNERRIFDIYATHLNQIFPGLAQSPSPNRRLVLRLIQELVQTEPTRMARILDEVVDFPEEKEEEILDLISQRPSA